MTPSTKNNLLCLSAILFLIVSGCSSVDLDTTIADGGVKLISPELGKAVEGRILHMTEYDSSAIVKFYKSGLLVGKNDQDDATKGVWNIDVMDRLCIKFKDWGYGETVCYSIYKVGDEYRQFSPAGLMVGRFSVAGNITEEKKAGKSSKETAIPPIPAVAPPPTASPSLLSEKETSTKQDKTDVSIAEKAKSCAGCDLQKADLTGANLTKAVLSGSNLTDANLQGANLKMANLRGATLKGADLSSANLAGANLAGADLTGANLTGAELFGTNLKGATLDDVIGADFMGAIK